MELILVVVISAGMAGNSQNGVSRSLSEEQFSGYKVIGQNEGHLLVCRRSYCTSPQYIRKL